MIGIINPTEYVRYRSPEIKAEKIRSKTDEESLQSLLEITQQYLVTNYNDEFVKSFVDEQARNKVKYYISDFIRDQRDYKFGMDISDVIDYIQTEITEIGVAQPVMDDASISSIEINGNKDGPVEVIVEKDGFPVHAKDIKFRDNDHVYRTIDKMLLPIGKTLTANEPIIDANYRGFRINVIMDKTRGGVSANGPIISIRKFPPDVFSDEECIAYGNLSKEMADFLKDVIPYGVNTIVTGGTNSGKTTQLIRFPQYYDPLTRFFCIEDSEEMLLKSKLSYRNYPNIVSVTVKEHEDYRKAYPISKLVKTSLRQNLDVMLIGEIRDEEAAKQAVVAANTGHIIHLTAHANGTEEAAVRFLQLMGNDPLAASQISMSFDLIFYQKYEATTGKRVVFEIAELIGFNKDKPILNVIFKYDPVNRVFKNVGKLKKLKDKLISEGAPQTVISRWCEV
jgi:pilus assembly protein CpaF